MHWQCARCISLSIVCVLSHCTCDTICGVVPHFVALLHDSHTVPVRATTAGTSIESVTPVNHWRSPHGNTPVKPFRHTHSGTSAQGCAQILHRPSSSVQKHPGLPLQPPLLTNCANIAAEEPALRFLYQRQSTPSNKLRTLLGVSRERHTSARSPGLSSTTERYATAGTRFISLHSQLQHSTSAQGGGRVPLSLVIHQSAPCNPTVHVTDKANSENTACV